MAKGRRTRRGTHDHGRGVLAGGVAGMMVGSVLATTAWAEDPAPSPEGTSATGAVAAPAGEEAGQTVRLAPVSVTATRNPIDPFLYPGMVTVVERESLQTLQSSTPADALKLVPGVAFTGGPRRSGEVPSLRGFTGADVVILVDGMRQNFGSGHDGRFFLDPAALSRVEVLRGSASSLYGSGGTGGVIDFRTPQVDDFLEPDQRFGFTVAGGVQSANKEWLGSLTTYARPMDGVDLLGQVSRRTSGSIRLGGGETLEDSDDSIVSALVKGGVELAPHHRLETSFSRFTNDAREPNNGQGVGGNDIVDKSIHNDNFRVAYLYNDPNNPWVNLDATAYYTTFSADELRLDSNGAGPVGELLTRDVNTLGMRLENRSRVGLGELGGVTFTYGVESYRDSQEGEASASSDRGGVPNADATFVGGFTQAEINLDSPLGLPGHLLLIPGARFDYYSLSSDLVDENTTESRVSPRFGVTYQPREWLMMFANYAEAFRAPTFNEMYLSGVHFQMPIGRGIVNRFVANPDLKPQTTRTVEVGGGLSFHDVITPRDEARVKVSHYRTWGEDFIDLAVNQPTPFADCSPFVRGACDGTTSSVNIPSARLWGTEVEAHYEMHRVRFGLGFSTIDGENTKTGEKLGILTPDTVTLDTALKLPEIDSVVGWRATLAGAFTKVNDPDEKRDAYQVHDLYYTYQPSEGPWQGARLDLGFDNVFDQEYSRVYTDATEVGRSFKMMLSYTQAW
ncbi:TonB-dependent hemoglobin/transferrin/lactoferrin family receptor [Pararhodospirillum photometricum]|uniref:TonB-dependent hemoglobin n=1 Tax=Pararhodospirillum photometricum DSM 122 TaxID=1150469 RepID=H6SMU3_PARPM|nr:TonB-dependent hemoglobin/transferrin/lactoferrin family receptor [Pararhodospirillum photometricum]CCG09228.1 TonB-dependent hemoglobin [Pararhodospirillum photometricum DSM 122]